MIAPVASERKQTGLLILRPRLSGDAVGNYEVAERRVHEAMTASRDHHVLAA